MVKTVMVQWKRSSPEECNLKTVLFESDVLKYHLVCIPGPQYLAKVRDGCDNCSRACSALICKEILNYCIPHVVHDGIMLSYIPVHS